MAVFGGLMDQAVKQSILNKQAARPMDPYKAGGPGGYMARVNRMRMGGRHQPGGDPRQQGGGGKARRQTVPGNAAGQPLPWQGGGGRQPEWGPGGNAAQGMARRFQAGAVAGQQRGQTSGKPNRQTVPPGTALGQPGQGGRFQHQGPGSGLAGGGRAAVAGGSRGGKPNRRMINRPAPGSTAVQPPVNRTAKRRQAMRTSARGGTFGGTTASRQRNQPTKGGLLARR